MKEYVSLTTATMKMGKEIFTVIRATVAKSKKMLHVESSGACHLYLMVFF